MLLSVAASECRLGMSSFICEENGMSSAVSLATHIQIVKFILNMHTLQVPTKFNDKKIQWSHQRKKKKSLWPWLTGLADEIKHLPRPSMYCTCIVSPQWVSTQLKIKTGSTLWTKKRRHVVKRSPYSPLALLTWVCGHKQGCARS